MTFAEWMAALAAAAGVAVSVAGWLVFAGKFHQKVEDLKEQVKAHDATIIAMQTVMTALQASSSQVMTKLDAQQEIWAVQIKALADKVQSGHDTLNAKLDGGDRLYGRELEQVKHDLRDVRQEIKNLPHPRRRSTAD